MTLERITLPAHAKLQEKVSAVPFVKSSGVALAKGVVERPDAMRMPMM